MKRYILMIMLIAVTGELVAQFIPNSNQPFQLMQGFNPAFTGVEPFTSVKVGYRSQWSSFPGAPRFLNLNASMRVGNPADVTHNALKSGTVIAEDEIPKAKRMVHGLGITLVQSSNGAEGIIENMEAGVTYSAHYPLKRGSYLAMGVSANYGAMRVRWENLDLKDPDPFVIGAQGSSFSSVNARTGLLFYSPKFYIHVAYLQLYSSSKTDPLTAIGYRYKGSAGIGTRVGLAPTMELRPSVMALVDEYDNIDIDYSLKMYYGSRAWGGFTYRDNGFAALILGFEINSLVGVSYSYEISTGGLQGFNSGSNEFIIGLKLANLKKLNPYIW